MQMCEVACGSPFRMKFARWLQTKHSVASWAGGPIQVIRCKCVVPFSLWKGMPAGTSPRIGRAPQRNFQGISRGSESAARLWELAVFLLVQRLLLQVSVPDLKVLLSRHHLLVVRKPSPSLPNFCCLRELSLPYHWPDFTLPVTTDRFRCFPPNRPFPLFAAPQMKFM